MSFVSEYNLGRDESTTYFLASLACSICELLHNGRSLHSQTGEAQADGTSHRHGHRPFYSLAPYLLSRSTFAKVLIAKRLSLARILAMEPVLCYSSHILMRSVYRPCVLCWKDMIRAIAFRVAGTSNWEILCNTYCTSQNITTDTTQSY